MIDKQTAEELNRILRALAAAENAHSPCCNSPSVEIHSLVEPVGRTGIFKCLCCCKTWDPTFREDADA